MSLDKKHEFMRECGDLYGNSLIAMMSAVCTQELHQQCSLLDTGTFFDSADLADRYRNEPEKLICIKTTANSFICPFRGVKMYEDKNKPEAKSFICLNCVPQIYEDRQYQSGHNAEESHTEKRKLDLLTCLLYTSPSPRDRQKSRMPSSA